MNIFEYYEKDELLSNKSMLSYYLKIKKRMRVNRFLFPLTWLFCIVLNSLIRLKIKRVRTEHSDNILLIGEKHYDSLKSYKNLILVFSAKSILQKFFIILSRGHKVYTYEDSYRYIFEAFSNSSKTSGLESKIRHLIKKNDIKKILMGNDNKPLERLWIKVAQSEGVITVVYQHGIWASSKMLPYQADGWVADYLFVYDNYHKNLMIKFGMESEKIITVGFPAPLYQSKLKRTPNTVCIVGSAGFSFGDGDYFYNLNNQVAVIASNLGLKVIYRPHPIEVRSKKIEVDVNMVTICYEPIEYALNAYHYYIGVSSTMLIESSLRGGTAIQILSSNVNVINFNKMGYAYTVSIGGLEQTLQNDRIKHYNLKLPKFLKDGDMAIHLEKLGAIGIE